MIAALIKRWIRRRAAANVLLSLRAEVERQADKAAVRMADPFFVDGHTGRNVAHDELLALFYIQDALLTPRPNEKATEYVQRVTAAMKLAEERFVSEQVDADGFGIGTFREFSVTLDALG